MNDPERCPECESFNTERVHLESYTDEIVSTRICHTCPVQYDVSYGDPIKQNVINPDGQE